MKKNYSEPTISTAEVVIEQGIAVSEINSMSVQNWNTTDGETIDF